jgi:hypothetical protein
MADEVAPAGWYPDPQIPNAVRWWDGRAWTSNTQPWVPTPVVVGNVYGSFLGLYFALLVPVLTVAILLVVANVWSWVPVVVFPVALILPTRFMRQLNKVTVSDYGVTFHSLRQDFHHRGSVGKCRLDSRTAPWRRVDL